MMHLGLAYDLFGSHSASWRHPDVKRGDMTDFKSHIAIAKKAEKALLDFLFMADELVVRGVGTPAIAGRRPPNRALDPSVTLAATAGVTEHIGLVASVNTTYTNPFTEARMVASLDHISGGRAGWNLVTGFNSDEAENFSESPHPPSHLRYERATEYAHVMFGLWDSWDADAFICEKKSGYFFDPAKMHPIHHHGKYFHCRGPLMVPRTPQGRPVTFQAGNSDAGRALAAETADVVFSVVTSLESAKSFYADVKERSVHYGRSPDDMRVLAGVEIFVGRTEEEGREKLAVLEESYDIVLALHQLNLLFGVDLHKFPLDEPVPELPVKPERGSRPYTLLELAKAGNLTLRQLAMKFGISGHWILTGTPTSVADTLQQYYDADGADGFIIIPPYISGGLDDVVDLVIPELQRRGLFRTRYEGATLRENLGLKMPAHAASRITY